jgi:hypothetical protein
VVKGFRFRINQNPPTPPNPVSVNAHEAGGHLYRRLERMGEPMLLQYAETEIMLTGQTFSQWREGLDPSLIDQAVQHAEWALDALKAVRDRG